MCHESRSANPDGAFLHSGPALHGPGLSPKSQVMAGLLCFFFGMFGVHRFYVGKVGTGIIQLLTLGGLGIWTVIDLIFIICGRFCDLHGNTLSRTFHD